MPFEWKRLVYSWAILNKLRLFFYILRPFGNGMWQFGIFAPVLVYCGKKNLATLLQKPIRTKFNLGTEIWQRKSN
jgi:hypothetical protein